MKIAYFITAHDEQASLDALLNKLVTAKVDKIVVLLDNPTSEIEEVVSKWIIVSQWNVEVFIHNLNKDYSEHKNIPSKFFQEDKFNFVFQIDADEMPSDFLVSAELKEMLEQNADNDLFFVPRINNFVGVTDEIAAQWGWDINNPNKYVNWNKGDFQGRIYRPHLKWVGKLHERIQGYDRYTFLPKEEEYALIHTKTIEKQVATNQKYNADYTKEENEGHNLLT